MRIYKKKITLILSVLLLFLSLFTPPQRVEAQGVVEWVFCKFKGEEFVKAKDTDVIPFLIRSKSAFGGQDSVEKNPLNQMLQFAGFNIMGLKDNEEIATPFEKFGMSGLNFTSYGGEWKYYNISPCDSDGFEGMPADDYGRFYAGRIEPQETFTQVADSPDPRVAQFNRGAGAQIWTIFQDKIANIIFSINKIIVTILLVFLGLSFENIPEKIGFGIDIQKNILSDLYTNLFLPLFILISIIIGVIILYRGIVKREFRRSLTTAALSIGIFIVAIIIGLRPQIVAWPNLIATTGQSLILGAFNQSNGSDEICSTAAGVRELDFTNPDAGLKQLGTNMKSSIGCRVWNNFLLKPWIQGQFGSDARYNDLSSEKIPAEEWIGEPKVTLGPSKSLNNWGIFALSVNTDRHETVKGVQSPLVNGVHKDFYRIIDALSGVNYTEELDESGELDRFLPNENGPTSFGSVPPGAGDFTGEIDDKGILERGAAYVSTIEQMLTKYGLDLKYTPILLAIAEQESNFGRGSECARLDPFQSAESLGLGPCGIKDPAISIEAGAKHFHRVITKAERLNLSIWAAIQSYNFGDGYMDWLSRKGIDHSLENALEFSNYMVNKLDWNPKGKINYTNHVSKNIVKTTYRYAYGVAHYAHEVAYKAGMSEEDVLAVAMGEGGTLPGYAGGSGNRIVNITPGGLVQRNEDGEIIVKIAQPAKTSKFWNTFIGNDNNRVSTALITLIFTLLALLAPLTLSIASVVYSLGLALMSAIAPVFLLLGAWPGRGQRIMLQWINMLFSTILKKIILGVLLVLSIEIIGTAFDLMGENGFIVTAIMLGISSLLILKNKDRIMAKMAQVNIGGIGTGGLQKAASSATNTVSGVAKTGAGIVTTSTVGYVTAKKMGISGSAGAKRAVNKYIENKLYQTGTFGTQAMTVKRMNSRDRQDSLYTGANKEGGITCVRCETLIYPGDVMFFNDNQDPICRVCGEELGGDLIEFTVPFKNSDEEEDKNARYKVKSKSEYKNFHVFYKDLNEAADKKQFTQEFISDEVNRLKEIIEEANQKSKEDPKNAYKVDFELPAILKDVVNEKKFNSEINEVRHNPEKAMGIYRKYLALGAKKLDGHWNNRATIDIKPTIIIDGKMSLKMNGYEEALQNKDVNTALMLKNDLEEHSLNHLLKKFDKHYDRLNENNNLDLLNFDVDNEFKPYINFEEFNQMKAQGATKEDYKELIRALFKEKKKHNKELIEKEIEKLSSEKNNQSSNETYRKDKTENLEGENFVIENLDEIEDEEE